MSFKFADIKVANNERLLIGSTYFDRSGFKNLCIGKRHYNNLLHLKHMNIGCSFYGSSKKHLLFFGFSKLNMVYVR